jgi:hypothetical protein
MAEKGLLPFFDTMMEQNLVDTNLFAFYMSMNPLNDDSELSFGSYDIERFEPGTLTWHPVIDKLFWSLNLQDVLINGISIDVC